MIKARRLFLIPALFSVLLFIPVIGIVLYILVIISWFGRNRENIYSYFQGINYMKDEISEEKLDELK